MNICIYIIIILFIISIYIILNRFFHKKEHYSAKELHDMWFNISDELMPFFGPSNNHIIKSYNNEMELLAFISGGRCNSYPKKTMGA